MLPPEKWLFSFAACAVCSLSALALLGDPPAEEAKADFTAVRIAPPKNAGSIPTPSRNSAVWWSLRPLSRPAVPKVKRAARVRTAIDAFILAKLEEMGLTPAAEVNRVTFLRRAKFDLHGLPPTPEEIEQFVGDTSPDAFERLIDRLLASPHYGERWGRHWLDIVHYADTHGFDKDKRRLWAWLFRDWIIRALNDDMPYDRFVLMQLAGDVLRPGDPDGIISTGFVVAGPWDFVGHVELREGTVEKMKTRLLDRDDMVASTMSTFVSVTAHCARCHDHKFDPISQKEYYQLQAVFAGVERGDRPFVSKEARAQITLLQRQKTIVAAERNAIQTKIRALTSPELSTLDVRYEKLRAELKSHPKIRDKKLSPTNGWHSGIERKQNVMKWVQIDLGRSLPIDEIRVFPARPTDFPDTPGFGFPVRFRIEISNELKFKKSQLVVDETDADFANPGDNALVLRPKKKSKARFLRITATKLWPRRNDYVFALAEVQVESGGKNVARGAKVTSLDSIEAGRWSKRNLVDRFDSRHQIPEPAQKLRQRWKLLADIYETERQRRRLAGDLIPDDLRDRFARADGMLALLDNRLKAARASSKVYSIKSIPPRPIHLLRRGNVLKKRGLVEPAALSLIPDLPGKLKIDNTRIEGGRRLALAKWITDKRNALTWRSIVNRVWQYHFGRGLVDSPNDFGKNGSRPTHPELLDWLAVEFRDGSMSLKKLHKLIMLSSVYRQSSKHNEANAKIDAGNRFLWRMNRRRLDAESLRDSVLAVSGQLNPKMGDPGFALFRFKDDHSPVYDHSDVRFMNDPKTFRRTVYRFVVRSVPNPFLECLDCADPNISVPKRNQTLTALQALALLNNPFMVKQASCFAERLQKHRKDPREQIERAYLLVFGRAPTPNESKLLVNYTRRHGLANTCRLLFNTNEFIFID